MASFAEILGNHGTVEGHHAAGVGKKRQQACDVAVADNNLRMLPDLFQVQRRDEVVAAISSAGADDGPHLVALKHLFQLADAALHRTGKIKLLLKNRRQIERLVSQL